MVARADNSVRQVDNFAIEFVVVDAAVVVGMALRTVRKARREEDKRTVEVGRKAHSNEDQQAVGHPFQGSEVDTAYPTLQFSSQAM